MRRGWLRRNRSDHPPAHDSSVRGDWCLMNPSGHRLQSFCPIQENQPHFFGEVSERRPWASKREDRPAAFAGRSKLVLAAGIPLMPIQASILSHPPLRSPNMPTRNPRNQGANNLRTSGRKIVTRYNYERMATKIPKEVLKYFQK